MKAEYVDHMGDDARVADCAWVSTDIPASERTIERRRKLLRYLARQNHWTPFAHCAVTIRMSAPVPITVQCYKHKVGFVENGESRRYVRSTPELYIPDYFRRTSESVKQGSIDAPHPRTLHWEFAYKHVAKEAVDLYESMIADGVAPEQARFVLPQGVLLRWIWTGSLAAYARFYAQRTDETAQKETRTLADQVSAIISPLFPYAWEVLTGVKHSNAGELEAVAP